jgi:hypothetical protein
MAVSDHTVLVHSVEELDRVRDAITLVMHDVEAVLGANNIGVIVDPSEAEIRAAFPRMNDLLWSATRERMQTLPGWVVGPDGSGVGLSWPGDLDVPEYVTMTASAIQELIIEDTRYWGMPFPPCALHSNHPMDATVVDGRACWTCPRDAVEPVEIGKFWFQRQFVAPAG